jgi:hypothetical protein
MSVYSSFPISGTPLSGVSSLQALSSLDKILVLMPINSGYAVKSIPYNSFISGVAETGYLTTGAGDSRYYAITNPNYYATSGNLNDVSGALSYEISQTGNYLLGLTGQFATQINLALTGSNLEGQIFVLNNQTGLYVLNSQTGIFASKSELTASGIDLQNQINNIYNSGFVTGFNSGDYVLKSQTGDFVGRGDTGIFALSSNLTLTGQSLSSSINNLSGILTGDYVTNISSGLLTGQFYPLNSNPSNYITSGDINNSQGGSIFDSGDYAQFNQYGQLDYRTTIIPDLNHDIDKRIWGLSPSTGNKQIFSVSNHTTATYVRNTGCWAYGIDLTPISVWNSQSADQRGGILISPRHVLMANHFPITGILRWVTNNNQVVSGSTSGHTSIAGTDIRIAVLSGDVTGVSYSKVFPNLFTGYFNTSGIPLFFTDQEEKALVAQTTTGFSTNININQSSNIYRSGFYETPIGGDSGGPICCVIGNELVAVSTLFSSSQGPYVSNYFTGVNAAINTLGNSNGNQLTSVSQAFFPINWNQIKDAPTNFSSIPANVVYTSGTQYISGYKVFLDQPITIAKSSDSNYYDLDTNLLVMGKGSYYALETRVSESAGVVSDAYFGFTLDGNPICFIDLLNKRLKNGYGDSNVAVDWANRILSGNWITNTTPTQSDHIINKGYFDNQTGLLQPSGNYLLSSATGSLTGVFYPLSLNPSSYITSGQTGQFASVINLGLTGAALQGQITILNDQSGLFVLNSNTGLFYPSSNPSQFISSGNADLRYYSVNNPSGFLTGIDLTNYATTGNLNSTGVSLETQINNLKILALAYAIAL